MVAEQDKLTLRLDRALSERLRTAAAQQRRNLSTVIEMAVAYYLAHEEEEQAWRTQRPR